MTRSTFNIDEMFDPYVYCGLFEILHVTAKAALVRHSRKYTKGIWIPLSQIHSLSEIDNTSSKGDLIMLVIKEWIALDKRLTSRPVTRQNGSFDMLLDSVA